MMNKEPLKENTIPMYMRLSFRGFMLLLLFGILTYEVLIGGTTSMDESVYSWIMNTFSPYFTPIFKAFTHIGGVYGIPIVALILTSILAYKKKYRIYAILTISTPVIIYFINTIIKNCIQRPRPDILRLISETGYSFPSGHTMHTVALYGLIILLSFYFIRNRSLKRTISIISLLIMVGVATSRIYLGVHYFSDILGGVFLPLLYLFIIKHIFFTKKVA